MEPSWLHFGAVLEASCKRLGDALGRLEAILSHHGRVLDGLGLSWNALRLSWEALGTVLALGSPSWADLGRLGDVLGRLKIDVNF